MPGASSKGQFGEIPASKFGMQSLPICVDGAGTKTHSFRDLLSQIEDLDQIRRGSITGEFVDGIHKDGSKVRRGPYTLYSFEDKAGRTVSRRLSAPGKK